MSHRTGNASPGKARGGPVNRALPGLVEGAATRDPAAVAIVDGERTITYGALAESMRRVASLMNEAGIERGDRVGLLIPKSIEAIVGLLGAMRAGAAYVPVDPGAPMRRARTILADAGIAALVTTAAELDRRPGLFDGDGAPRPRLVLGAGEIPVTAPGLAITRTLSDEPGTGAVPMAPGPDDLAYILYTSGSTGQPKGVMLTHRNALAFVEWAVDELMVTSADRLSSHAPFHFDLSVFDLYAAFAAGARLHLVPATLSYFPLPLARWIANQGITVWYSVPSILGRMAEQKGFSANPTRLRAVVFAGEVFPIPALRALQDELPGATLHNWYGPTETNVCTYHHVEARIPGDRREPLPIGIECPYAESRIVDPDGNEARPGDEGELWIAGDSVLRGYWNDPERTANALATDPRPGGPADRRFYRTGDIVRRQPDGTLAFLGRRDAMVKVRGYRVELGDVEAALHDHAEVADAAVVPVSGEDGQTRLFAVVARRNGSTLSDAVLQRHCVERLPRYMVPERIVWLDALPRTSTGKVDRVGLAQQLEAGHSGIV